MCSPRTGAAALKNWIIFHDSACSYEYSFGAAVSRGWLDFSGMDVGCMQGHSQDADYAQAYTVSPMQSSTTHRALLWALNA